MDKEFNNVRLKSPVLLKIDVQGYETQVLKGGKNTLKRVEYVVLEASCKPLYQDEKLFMDIVKTMDEYGFSFLRPVGMLADPHTGEIIQMDILFKNRAADQNTCAS